MSIVLLTDFGLQDGYVGVMKGVIKGICPDADILDLSHDIPAQNLEAAKFVLWNSYKYFPKGSIFVCVVDPGVGSSRPIIAVQTEEYVFIAPDNGLLDFVLAQLQVKQMFAVENSLYMRNEISNTFHGRDIFAPVAAHLKKGALITQLGPLHHYSIPKNPFVSMENGSEVEGKILYIDQFGNLITNIKFTFPLSGQLIMGSHVISLKNSYSDVKIGELVCLAGSHGLLEIAVREGNASNVLRIGYGQLVRWIS